MAYGGGGGDVMPSEVDQFIMNNQVDERAGDALRACAPHVQRAVMDRGDLQARNPSSALMVRIRDAQSGGGGPMQHQGGQHQGGQYQGGQYQGGQYQGGQYQGGMAQSGGGYGMDSVEDFIQVSGLDERAATALRGCPSDVQSAVIARGYLTDMKNPSSALIGRIRDAQQGTGGGGGKGSWGGGSWDGYGGGQAWGAGGGGGGGTVPGELEGFISKNQLDERAAEALRACTPQVQRAVMDRGDFQDSRHPSSALMVRIRDAQSVSGGRGGNWGGYGPSRGGSGGYGGYGPYGGKGMW